MEIIVVLRRVVVGTVCNDVGKPGTRWGLHHHPQSSPHPLPAQCSPLTKLLFVFKVTLLSFAVESECTFLDYIKGG